MAEPINGAVVRLVLLPKTAPSIRPNLAASLNSTQKRQILFIARGRAEMRRACGRGNMGRGPGVRHSPVFRFFVIVFAGFPLVFQWFGIGGFLTGVWCVFSAFFGVSFFFKFEQFLDLNIFDFEKF
jgi:hypothetical protein